MGLIPLGILSAAAGGQLPAYELIESQILGSTAASITFSSLGTYSAVYKHLQVRIMARSNGPYGEDAIRLRFNADTGANYSFHQLTGTGSTVVSGALTSQTGTYPIQIGASSSAANIYGGGFIDILDPYSTTKNTTVRALSGVNGSTSVIILRSGAWLNTASITTIGLTPIDGSTFNTGSRFSLYGIR
jgi:hypothetical protein